MKLYLCDFIIIQKHELSIARQNRRASPSSNQWVLDQLIPGGNHPEYKMNLFIRSECKSEDMLLNPRARLKEVPIL